MTASVSVHSTGVFEEWVREGSFSVEEAAALCSDLLASSFEAVRHLKTEMSSCTHALMLLMSDRPHICPFSRISSAFDKV